jgi:hypothetical protein
MKKLIASLLALGTAGLLSAQVHFGVGARGTFGFGLGTSLADDYSSDYNKVQPFKSFLAGGSVIGRLSFDAVPGLFIQPEIGFTHTQVGTKTDYSYTSNIYSGISVIGTKTKEHSYEQSAGSNAIDIPILVGYDFEVGTGMVVSPFAGLNFSIPVGSISGGTTPSYTETITYKYNNGTTSTEKEHYRGDSSSTSFDVKATLNPGIVLGAGFGYKFDEHNMIMGDLRYLLDFIPTKAEVKWGGIRADWDLFTRRGLTLGFSYVYFIN